MNNGKEVGMPNDIRVYDESGKLIGRVMGLRRDKNVVYADVKITDMVEYGRLLEKLKGG